jgi:uncharacterized protein YlzI (FlbEa/FlbD family)
MIPKKSTAMRLDKNAAESKIQARPKVILIVSSFEILLIKGNGEVLINKVSHYLSDIFSWNNSGSFILSLANRARNR